MAGSLKILLADKPRKDGLYAVRFRITINRVVRYVNTGIFIKPEAWNNGADHGKQNWVIKRYEPLFSIHNSNIASDFTWLRTCMQTNRTWSADQVKAGYEKHSRANTLEPEETPVTTFYSYAANYISNSKYAAHTRIFYASVLSKLEAFAPDLSFATLDVSFVQRYKDYMQTEKNNGPVTIKNNCSLLHNIAARAVKEGHITSNPFDEISYNTGRKRKKKIRPTVQELNVKNPTFTQPLSTPEQHAWNVFRMQYFLHGARVGDVIELSWENIKEGRMEYTARKNKVFKSIKISAEIESILAQYPQNRHYIFPYLKDAFWKLKNRISDKEWEDQLAGKKLGIEITINKHLKTVAVKAGITIKLSSHMSRHMVADAVLSKTKDLRAVQKYFGHSSMTTSENYIQDLTDTELDSIDDLVYDL